MINAQIKALKDSPAQATKLLRILSAIYRNEMLIRDDVIEDPTFRIRAYASKTKELLFDPSGRWPALDAIMKVEDVTMRAAWLVMLFTGMPPPLGLSWGAVDAFGRTFEDRAMTDAIQKVLDEVPEVVPGAARTVADGSVCAARVTVSKSALR